MGPEASPLVSGPEPCHLLVPTRPRARLHHLSSCSPQPHLASDVSLDRGRLYKNMGLTNISEYHWSQQLLFPVACPSMSCGGPGHAMQECRGPSPQVDALKACGDSKTTQKSQALRRSQLGRYMKLHSRTPASPELHLGPWLGIGPSVHRPFSGEKQDTPKSKPCSCHLQPTCDLVSSMCPLMDRVAMTGSVS